MLFQPRQRNVCPLLSTPKITDVSLLLCLKYALLWFTTFFNERLICTPVEDLLISMARFVFHASGDPKITAEHPTTLEITKEGVKSKRGDCIVAAMSSTGLKELPDEIRKAALHGDTMTLVIEAGGYVETIKGKGSGELTFADENEIVIRKSGFACGRTLMIHSDKAAADLDRGLVNELRKDGCAVKVTIITG